MTLFKIIITIDCKKDWRIEKFVQKIMKSLSQCVLKENMTLENIENNGSHFFPKCQNNIYVIYRNLFLKNRIIFK